MANYTVTVEDRRTNYVPQRPIRVLRRANTVSWWREGDEGGLRVTCTTLPDAKELARRLRRAGDWAHRFTDRVKAEAA